MLTDIVGFTTLAEQSTPEAVTDFVNRHFTMLNALRRGARAATLAQFIGDSVMAFWGAPDPQPDHAARACRAALAIAAALEAENGAAADRGEPPIRMRIGINTGEVTAGNVGAPGRSNYGIVGDTVNTTQRIEQLAKTICHDQPTAAILVSGRTRTQAGDGFAFVEAGAHALRGRQELCRSTVSYAMRAVSTTARARRSRRCGPCRSGPRLTGTDRRRAWPAALAAMLALVPAAPGCGGGAAESAARPPGAAAGGQLVSVVGEVSVNGAAAGGRTLPFVPICAGDLIAVGVRPAGPRSTCSKPTRPCGWTRTRSAGSRRRPSPEAGSSS